MNQDPLLPPEVPLPELYPNLAEHPELVVPIVFEDDETERVSLRAYAAIQLRIPDTGIDWLDKMIERSRKLDK